VSSNSSPVLDRPGRGRGRGARSRPFFLVLSELRDALLDELRPSCSSASIAPRRASLGRGYSRAAGRAREGLLRRGLLVRAQAGGSAFSSRMGPRCARRRTARRSAAAGHLGRRALAVDRRSGRSFPAGTARTNWWARAASARSGLDALRAWKCCSGELRDLGPPRAPWLLTRFGAELSPVLSRARTSTSDGSLTMRRDAVRKVTRVEGPIAPPLCRGWRRRDALGFKPARG
jgi:hypothetical protein